MLGLGIGFNARKARAADVDAVVLRAGLEEEAFGVDVAEGEGAEKVAEEGLVDFDELFGVGPGWLAGRWRRLEVGVEEDVCGS